MSRLPFETILDLDPWTWLTWVCGTNRRTGWALVIGCPVEKRRYKRNKWFKGSSVVAEKRLDFNEANSVNATTLSPCAELRLCERVTVASKQSVRKFDAFEGGH